LRQPADELGKITIPHPKYPTHPRPPQMEVASRKLSRFERARVEKSHHGLGTSL